MNTNKSQSSKFVVTFATVFAVHIAIVGIFIGSVAYGETGNIKVNEQLSDKHYVGVDEEFPQPQNTHTVQKEQTNQPTQINQSQPTNNPAVSHQPITNSFQHAENSAKKNSPHITTKTQHQLQTTTYTVKSGDTLYSISKKYKLSIKRLIEINKIKDTNKITVGQVLKFM